jgi:AcrR family transcriptional regulator
MAVLTSNKKCAAILQAAQRLFWKHGFRRVTIDEICREAKTSKMTFYRFFPNKLEVARAVFDMVADEGLVKFKELMKGDTSPADKMNKILMLKMEGTNEISNEFISDFYSNPELGLSSYIEEKSKIMWKETLGLFKAGQTEGWIRKDMNVEFMFLLMQKTVPMLTDKEVLKLYNSPQELIKELANMFLYGISPSALK